FIFLVEDGIRDFHVTGVQTCALPICCDVRRMAAKLSVSPAAFDASTSNSQSGSCNCKCSLHSRNAECHCCCQCDRFCSLTGHLRLAESPAPRSACGSGRPSRAGAPGTAPARRTHASIRLTGPGLVRALAPPHHPGDRGGAAAATDQRHPRATASRHRPPEPKYARLRSTIAVGW